MSPPQGLQPKDAKDRVGADRIGYRNHQGHQQFEVFIHVCKNNSAGKPGTTSVGRGQMVDCHKDMVRTPKAVLPAGALVTWPALNYGAH